MFFVGKLTKYDEADWEIHFDVARNVEPGINGIDDRVFCSAVYNRISIIPGLE